MCLGDAWFGIGVLQIPAKTKSASATHVYASLLTLLCVLTGIGFTAVSVISVPAPSY